MNNFDMTLMHFSAGEVINSTEGTLVDGAVSDSSALSPEMKTFYDKTLITLAGANLIHEQFGQKRPVPKGSGKSVEFRRFSRLPKALKPITEGVTPAGNKLNVTAVSCTVDQYGDYIEQTDMLELTAVDNTIVEATKELASQAGLTLDTVVRNELVGGTNVMYAPEVTNGTEKEILSRSDINKNCRLRVKDVFRAAAELKAVNAPKINGSYVAVIHPYVAYDLMQEAGDKWLSIAKYVNPENILKGEIGALGGVRFVESTEAKIFAPDEISNGISRMTVAAKSDGVTVTVNEDMGEKVFFEPVEVYVNGAPNTVVSVNGSTVTLGSAASVNEGSLICGKGGGKDGSAVFSTLFLGENAYGEIGRAHV